MSLDPYIGNVSLLLHCESAVDSAFDATITPNNGASFSTTNPKFGSRSLALNGSSQYLSFPASTNYALGTGPFTIECWVYLNSIQHSGFAWGGSGAYFFGLYDGTLRFDPLQISWAPSTGTWYAIAADRDINNVLRLYVDGSMIGSMVLSPTDSFGTGSISLSIGSQLPTYNDSNVNGYIDEYRLTKGVARYASNSGYTVQTAEFPDPDTAISADPNFSKVVVLMHCDNSEELAKNATITLNGGATFSTTKQKFGTGSLSVNGSAQYASLPSNNFYTFNYRPFTIECWVNFTVVQNSTFVTTLTSNNWWFGYYGGNISFTSVGGTNVTYAWTPSTNTWYAVAAERDNSGKLRLYINGVMVASSAYVYNVGSAASVLNVGSQRPATTNVDTNGYIDEVRVTRGVARYASDSGYTVTTAPFPPMYVTDAADTSNIVTATPTADPAPWYNAGAVDSLTYADASDYATRYTDEASDYLTQQDISKAAYSLTSAFVPGLSDSTTTYIRRVAQAFDTFYANHSTATKLTYNVSALDRPKMQDITNLARLVGIADTAGVQDVYKIVQSLRVVESLKLGSILVAGATYRQTLTETVRWAEALGRFFGGDIIEGLGIHSVLAPRYSFKPMLADTIGVHHTTGNNLVLRVTASDKINIDDVDILKMIFSPVISDDVELAAAYVSPDGNLTTWAVNTRTGAVTEYQNYGFNSFAQFGHKYVGASGEGLFELDGEDDAGDDIIAKIKSGYMQFGGARFSSFKAAYLGIRGDTGDRYIFRLVTADGKNYDYEIQAHNMQTTKIHLGKGLRSRYFSFELISTGPDFDLESVELVPLVAQRRV